MLPWVFARIVVLESRRVHVLADDELRGVALWVPPSTRPTRRSELMRARFPLLPWKLGRESFQRVEAFQAASRGLLERFGYSASWFLSGLGVDPAAQRGGIGTRLVRWGLERAGDSRRPAVLLTSNEENIAFYERLGFEAVAEERLPAEGPRTWAMRSSA